MCSSDLPNPKPQTPCISIIMILTISILSVLQCIAMATVINVGRVVSSDTIEYKALRYFDGDIAGLTFNKSNINARIDDFTTVMQETTLSGYSKCGIPKPKGPSGVLIQCHQSVSSILKPVILWFRLSNQPGTPSITLVSKIQLNKADDDSYIDFIYSDQDDKVYVLTGISNVYTLSSFWPMNPVGPTSELVLQDFSKVLRIKPQLRRSPPAYRFSQLAIVQQAATFGLQVQLVNISEAGLTDIGTYLSDPIADASTLDFYYTDNTGIAVIKTPDSIMTLVACNYDAGDGHIRAEMVCKQSIKLASTFVGKSSSYYWSLTSLPSNKSMASQLVAIIEAESIMYVQIDKSGVMTAGQTIEFNLQNVLGIEKVVGLSLDANREFKAIMLSKDSVLYGFRYLTSENKYSIIQFPESQSSYYQYLLIPAQDNHSTCRLVKVGSSELAFTPVADEPMIVLKFDLKVIGPMSVSVTENHTQQRMIFKADVVSNVGNFVDFMPEFPFQQEYSSFIGDSKIFLKIVDSQYVGNNLRYEFEGINSTIQSEVIHFQQAREVQLFSDYGQVNKIRSLNDEYVAIQKADGISIFFRCLSDSLSLKCTPIAGLTLAIDIEHAIAVHVVAYSQSGYQALILTSNDTNSIMTSIMSNGDVISTVYDACLATASFIFNVKLQAIELVAIGAYSSSQRPIVFYTVSTEVGMPVVYPKSLLQITSDKLDDSFRLSDIEWSRAGEVMLIGEVRIAARSYIRIYYITINSDTTMSILNEVNTDSIDPNIKYCLMDSRVVFVNYIEKSVRTFELKNSGFSDRLIPLKDLDIDINTITSVYCDRKYQNMVSYDNKGQIIVIDTSSSATSLDTIKLIFTDPLLPRDFCLVSIADMSLDGNPGMLYMLSLRKISLSVSCLLLGDPILTLTPVAKVPSVLTDYKVKLSNGIQSISSKITINSKLPENRIDWIVNRVMDINSVTAGQSIKISDLVTFIGHVRNYSVNSKSTTKLASISQAFKPSKPYWDIEGLITGPYDSVKSAGKYLAVYAQQTLYIAQTDDSPNTTRIILKKQVSIHQFTIIEIPDAFALTYVSLNATGGITLGLVHRYNGIYHQESRVYLPVQVQSIVSVHSTRVLDSLDYLGVVSMVIRSSNGTSIWNGLISMTAMQTDMFLIYQTTFGFEGMNIISAYPVFVPDSSVRLMAFFDNDVRKLIMNFTVNKTSISVIGYTLDQLPAAWRTSLTRNTYCEEALWNTTAQLFCLFFDTSDKLLGLKIDMLESHPKGTGLYELRKIPGFNVTSVALRAATVCLFGVQAGMMRVLYYRPFRSSYVQYSEDIGNSSQPSTASLVEYQEGRLLLAYRDSILYRDANEPSLIINSSLSSNSLLISDSSLLQAYQILDTGFASLEFSKMFYAKPETKNKLALIGIILIIVLLLMILVLYIFRARYTSRHSIFGYSNHNTIDESMTEGYFKTGIANEQQASKDVIARAGTTPNRPNNVDAGNHDKPFVRVNRVESSDGLPNDPSAVDGQAV